MEKDEEQRINKSWSIHSNNKVWNIDFLVGGDEMMSEPWQLSGNEQASVLLRMQPEDDVDSTWGIYSFCWILGLCWMECEHLFNLC